MTGSSLGNFSPPSFQNDLSVLDRYQAFSAEMVRISLLALSALGALIFKAVIDGSASAGRPVFELSVRCWLIAAAVTFGICAAAALLHRYWSSDSMACQLRLLRLEEAEGLAPDERKRELQEKIYNERQRRKFTLTLSARSIGVAVVSLALGGIAFVVAIGIVLLGR